MAVDGGTLAAIKAAIDSGRLLLEVGRACDQAEIRLKVVELVSALTDAKRAKHGHDRMTLYEILLPTSLGEASRSACSSAAPWQRPPAAGRSGSAPDH